MIRDGSRTLSTSNLRDRNAVITGGASGIGLAIARRFAEHGAAVHIIDLDELKVQEAIKLISNSGRQVIGHTCNVSDENSVNTTFSEIGPVQILVNSAGIAHVGNLGSTTPADMDRLFAVNVRGVYLCMKAVIDAMTAANHGIILNLASIAATRGLSDRFAYSMTKGAVLSMTLSVAKDYIDKGIRCNCISPARIHTPFVDGFLARNYPGQEAEKMKVLAAAQPIGRMGTPDEVAALAHFLCSEEASFITGADIPLDGGFLNLR
jgi:NAD(P)-dependent dehydrogenase (short-subunit alcohol dehydrogenase family)